MAPGTQLQHPTEAAIAATIGGKESKADWIDGVPPAMAVELNDDAAFKGRCGQSVLNTGSGRL